MSMKNEPCSICEEWIDGVICDKDKCPVAIMKAENERQKAEIERLKMEREALDDAIYPLPFKTDFDIAIETAKVEAYKEFADLFKQEMRNCANAEFDGIKYYLIGEEFVNRRVKEMTEESNEKET